MPEQASLRPRDLAVLLLASGDLLPRHRARDQQADLAGLELKRRLLQQAVAVDPEPSDLERTLISIVEEFGPPTGPTRALALSFLEEWHVACTSPEWLDHLLNQAVHESSKDSDTEAAAMHRRSA
jgi:hypothetical protein